MIFSGTGSRDLALAPPVHRASVSYFIRRELLKRLPESVISGGAEGFDHLLALNALTLEIPLILAVPSPDYGEYYWTKKSITGMSRASEWNEMLEHAARVVYVSSWHMNGRANLIRNQWMVDNADDFLVYKPSSRGTSDCVRRIEAAGKPYTVVEITCRECKNPVHYNGPNPHCEHCSHELCNNCDLAEAATWD